MSLKPQAKHFALHHSYHEIVIEIFVFFIRKIADYFIQNFAIIKDQIVTNAEKVYSSPSTSRQKSLAAFGCQIQFRFDGQKKLMLIEK
jgi:hypothetical protein